MPQTFQKSKAWRRTGIVAQTLEECAALAACSPEVSHKRPRIMQPGQHMHQKAQPHIAGIRDPILASLFTRGGADPSTFAACRRGCAAWHEPRRHKTLEDDRDVHMQRRRALLISDSGALFGSKARHFVAVSQLSCLVSVWTAPFLCQFSNNSALNEARTNPIGCAPPGAQACGGAPARHPDVEGMHSQSSIPMGGQPHWMCAAARARARVAAHQTG